MKVDIKRVKGGVKMPKPKVVKPKSVNDILSQPKKR
jgi:hypothetical protein